MEIYAGQEYVLNVQIIRLGSFETLHIHCPKFPKGKDEGWFLTLGHQAEAELIALKRCVYRSNKSSHQLCFYAPKRLGMSLTIDILVDSENQPFFFKVAVFIPCISCPMAISDWTSSTTFTWRWLNHRGTYRTQWHRIAMPSIYHFSISCELRILTIHL